MAQQQPSGALNSVLGDRGRLGSGLQPQLAVGANAPGNQLQVPGMPARHTVDHGSCRMHRVGTAIKALILQSFRPVQPACACTAGYVLLSTRTECLSPVSLGHELCG